MEQDHSYTSVVESPIGFWLVKADESALTGVGFKRRRPNVGFHQNDVSREAASQLNDYFLGLRENFNIRLNLTDYSPFFIKVWKALLKIPYGKTISYSELAEWIHNPHAVRAVGHANARNPFPIIVPCHRVIGKDHSLTGYALGKDIKKWLLVHEGSWVEQGVLF